MIEKLAHFDRERIPVVHANGSGAYGYFEVLANLKAEGIQFFSEPKTIKIDRGSPRRFFGDQVSFVCFTDPDGIVIELIDFPNG